jgi:cytoskeletal protein CcmA (bactofilin family)
MSSMFTRNSDKPGTAADTPTNAPVQPAAKVETAPAAPRPAAVIEPQTRPGAARGVSVISKALKITGQLESTEDIQIEGQVDGDVRAVSVKVGSDAKVKGTVYGDEVELAGSVEGKIEARKVVLTGTAHMAGDVVHQDITIQSGAYVDGHLKPEYGKKSSTVQKLESVKS